MRSRKDLYQMKKGFSSRAKVRIGVVVVLTVVQWGAMYGFDQYLQPAAVATVTHAAASTTPQVQPVSVPADAVRTAMSADEHHAAYTTQDNQLVIADKNGPSFQQQQHGPVVYLQWLGNSNTLLYFVQGSYLDAYLLPLNSTQPVLIHEWWGDQRNVKHTYFSSYMEYLYMELQNGDITEVYKYDALGGISQLPLENVQIDSIAYDEKTDVMNLTASDGGVWRYENDLLYRPDGSLVYQSNVVHHPRPTGTTTILAPAPGTGKTGTDKTGTGAAGANQAPGTGTTGPGGTNPPGTVTPPGGSAPGGTTPPGGTTTTGTGSTTGTTDGTSGSTSGGSTGTHTGGTTGGTIGGTTTGSTSGSGGTAPAPGKGTTTPTTGTSGISTGGGTGTTAQSSTGTTSGTH